MGTVVMTTRGVGLLGLVNRLVVALTANAKLAIEPVRTNQAEPPQRRKKQLAPKRRARQLRPVPKPLRDENAKYQKPDSGRSPTPDARVTMRAPSRNECNQSDNGNNNQKNFVKAVLPKTQKRSDRKETDNDRSQEAMNKTEH